MKTYIFLIVLIFSLIVSANEKDEYEKCQKLFVSNPEEAFNHCIQSRKEGNIKASIYIAKIYASLGNYKLAVGYLEDANSYGDFNSNENYFMEYGAILNQTNSNKDTFEKSIEIIKIPLAFSNTGFPEWIIAEMYYNINEPTLGCQWAEKAAQKNNRAGLTSYATCLSQETKDVKLDKRKALKLLKKAILPRPWLGVEITNSYDPEGVKVINIVQDTPAAKFGFQKDDIISQVDSKNIYGIQEMISVLDQQYRIGDYVTFTLNRDNQIFEKTVILDENPQGVNSFAYLKLGEFYYQSKNDPEPQSFPLAFEYFKKASEQIDPVHNSFTWIGFLYEQGKGVSQNWNKAKEYYEKTLKINPIQPFALERLAIFYQDGKHGIKVNKNKAEEYNLRIISVTKSNSELYKFAVQRLKDNFIYRTDKEITVAANQLENPIKNKANKKILNLPEISIEQIQTDQKKNEINQDQKNIINLLDDISKSNDD